MWKNNNIFEEQVFFNTVLIENLSEWEFWTWFLIEKEVGFNWNWIPIKAIMLFSNKHVFLWSKNWQTSDSWITKSIKFYFHSKDTQWELVLWKKIECNLEINVNSHIYFWADNPNEDVACCIVSNIYNITSVWNKSINNVFLDFDYRDLRSASSVIFAWYPNGLYDVKNYLPLLRSWILSSKPEIDFNWERKILIDANVYPGSSWSPVFAIIKPWEYSLIWILTSASTWYFFKEVSDNEKKIPIVFTWIWYLHKIEIIKEIIEKVYRKFQNQ